MGRQFSSAPERGRGGGRTSREKSQRLRGRAKDQGLARGWIECYDVLRRVVATKTMRLVTVIVRSVRLRAVTNRVVPTLRCNPLVVSAPLFRPLLLPPRVMKRSFVLVLLFTPATNSANVVLLFQTGARENNAGLRPQMLRIYDLHSVDFAYARFMSEINANKNLSKPKCSANCIERRYSNFIKQYIKQFIF